MRVYLAGGESMANLLKWGGAKYVLVSYYYLREKGEKSIERLLKDFPYIFMDSGAFTLQQHLIKERVDPNSEEFKKLLDNYIDNYIDFLNKYGPEFEVIAEVDVGNWQQKTRMRERIESRLESGITLMPVIHRRDPDIYLEYLCRNYSYVALGTLRSDRTLGGLKKYVGQRLIIPKKYGTKVHGFALTVVEIMKSQPLYSVDSASWLHGSE